MNSGDLGDIRLVTVGSEEHKALVGSWPKEIWITHHCLVNGKALMRRVELKMTKSPIDDMDFVLGVVDAGQKIHNLQTAHTALLAAMRARDMPGIGHVNLAFQKAIGMQLFSVQVQLDRFKPAAPPPAASVAEPRKNPRIIPVTRPGDYAQGRLIGINKAEIDAVLGFTPNINDDPNKVRYSWGFMVDGVRCGVWDYKGSFRRDEWSTYGPGEELALLFGERYKPAMG